MLPRSDLPVGGRIALSVTRSGGGDPMDRPAQGEGPSRTDAAVSTDRRDRLGGDGAHRDARNDPRAELPTDN